METEMQAQETLDFTRRVRRADPGTSLEAAKRAASFASSHAGRIHLALVANGPCSAHELRQHTGLSVVQIDRRMVEMKRSGLIRVAVDHWGNEIVKQGCRVWEAVKP